MSEPIHGCVHGHSLTERKKERITNTCSTLITRLVTPLPIVSIITKYHSRVKSLPRLKSFYVLPDSPLHLTIPVKERYLWFIPDLKGLLLLRQVALVYSLPIAVVHIDQQALT